MQAPSADANHAAWLMLTQRCATLQMWNFLLGASGVFLFPYIPIFLQSRGLSSAQIGMLAALRPWLAAPIRCGFHTQQWPMSWQKLIMQLLVTISPTRVHPADLLASSRNAAGSHLMLCCCCPYSMTTSALADQHKVHVKLLLASAALGALIRSSMPLADSATILVIMLLAGELIGAPTGVLGDSTVLSNCNSVSTCAWSTRLCGSPCDSTGRCARTKHAA